MENKIEFKNNRRTEYIKMGVSDNGYMEIDIFGPIGRSMFEPGYTLEQFLSELSMVTTKKIVVNIGSYGGNLYEALAIFDSLQALKKVHKVVTKVVRSSASAGTLLSLAGTHGSRLITKNSRYLIHKPILSVSGNSDDLQGVIDLLKDLDKQIIKLYVENSKMAENEVLELMSKETFISAEKAIELGLVDGYVDDEKFTKNQNINNMTQEILDALGVNTENEAYDKIVMLIGQSAENEVEDTPATESASDEATEKDENTEAPATEPEVENSEADLTDVDLKKEDEEEDTKGTKDKEDEEEEDEKLIAELKEKIKKLEKQLAEKEKEEAENRATVLNDYLDGLEDKGIIIPENRDTWFEVGVDRGLEYVQNLLRSVPASKDEKISTRLEVEPATPRKTAREQLENDFFSNKITMEKYQKELEKLK